MRTGLLLGKVMSMSSRSSAVVKLMHPMTIRLLWSSPVRRNQNNATGQVRATGGQQQQQGENSLKWDMSVGVCLERRPVITKDLTPLEKKYAAFLTQYEVELSKRSDHEIRRDNDAKLLEKIKKGEVDQGTVQTGQDFEDEYAKELQAFQPASRTTEADKKNDIKSLDRSLQSHLLLVVKQKFGQDFKWVVPQMKVTNEDNLRQVADQAIATFCPDVKAKVLGNAPWGFYKYKYPKDLREDTGITGCKIFFYKAQLLSGQVTVPKGKTSDSTFNDYAWLTRVELPKYFGEAYYDELSDLLIPEN